MSKFNSTKKSGPSEINFMGEEAYELSDKEKLASMVMTTFLTDSYYVKEGELVSKIKNLAEAVGPEFTAKLAPYARKTGNMRTVSHLLAALVCKDKTQKKWLSRFYRSIVVRPDDMSEILCAYAMENKIDLSKTFKKIPNAMKKGFAKVLENLNPYTIDKYKMNGKSLSLIDIINLVHRIQLRRMKKHIAVLCTESLLKEHMRQRFLRRKCLPLDRRMT